jgi:hypothetical protein
MRFVIDRDGVKVAEVRDAVPAAKIATMFGAGTEVFVRDWSGELTQVARIDVTGQVIEPEHLDSEAARLV